MDSESSKARWLTRRNLEELLHLSDSNYHEGMTLPLSPHMCPPTRTLFPHNKHFTYFTTCHFFLCGNSFLRSQWSCASSLATDPAGLVASVQCSWPDFSLWYQNPASRHCRPRPTKLRTAVVFQEVKKKGKWLTSCAWLPGTEKGPHERTETHEGWLPGPAQTMHSDTAVLYVTLAPTEQWNGVVCKTVLLWGSLWPVMLSPPAGGQQKPCTELGSCSERYKALFGGSPFLLSPSLFLSHLSLLPWKI